MCCPSEFHTLSGRLLYCPIPFILPHRNAKVEMHKFLNTKVDCMQRSSRRTQVRACTKSCAAILFGELRVTDSQTAIPTGWVTPRSARARAHTHTHTQAGLFVISLQMHQQV